MTPVGAGVNWCCGKLFEFSISPRGGEPPFLRWVFAQRFFCAAFGTVMYHRAGADVPVRVYQRPFLTYIPLLTYFRFYFTSLLYTGYFIEVILQISLDFCFFL